MDITPLLTTFGLIAAAEFGDKTQLIVVALSARYDRLRVFVGVILAFALITGLGILVGETLLQLIDPALIRIIAGIFFLVFGILTLLPEKENDADDNVSLGNPLISTFSMIALAEMGDKTQLSVIALSARYDSPYLVFIGAVLALGLISLIGILIGKKLTGILPLQKIKLGAGIMFILFGILFLAGFI